MPMSPAERVSVPEPLKVTEPGQASAARAAVIVLFPLRITVASGGMRMPNSSLVSM